MASGCFDLKMRNHQWFLHWLRVVSCIFQNEHDQMVLRHIAEGGNGKTTHFASILALGRRLVYGCDMDFAPSDHREGSERIRFDRKVRSKGCGTEVYLVLSDFFIYIIKPLYDMHYNQSFIFKGIIYKWGLCIV